MFVICMHVYKVDAHAYLYFTTPEEDVPVEIILSLFLILLLHVQTIDISEQLQKSKSSKKRSIEGTGDIYAYHLII